MTLNDIKLALAERGLQLTKSLGQNFLHDQNQIRRIISAAEVGPADKILEIGPGMGPLTELLVEKAGEVLAIEKDRRLFNYLSDKFSATANLKLVHADALDYFKEHQRWAGWKLAANLPFSMASPLLVELAAEEEPPEMLVGTLQLEVAQRVEATAGSEQYGVLGLLLRLRYESRGWFKIPAACFFPPPDVDSACIILSRRVEPLLTAALHGTFTRIVKRGFSQRRKMMLKLLKQDWLEDGLRRGFEQAGVATTTRAEKVSLEQFVRLTETLSQMSENIFDIVNERDEVIGRLPRRQVHRQGHKHRAIHVLVFNARGDVFLQKRSMSKDTFPGAWDSSASGHVDSGEDYDAAAVRELHEELGLALGAPPARLFKIDACAETGQEFVWVYRLESEGPFVLCPEEIERGEWFSPALVKVLLDRQPGDFASGFVKIWRQLAI